MSATRTAPAPGSTYRTVVPGIAMIAVTFGLARYGYGLLLPEMRADLGIGSGAAGLIASSTYASYLLANLGVVGLVTRYGARAAVASAAVCGVLGMAVVSLAQDPWVLALGVLVGGAASGFAFPPYAEIVDTEVPAAHRDLAWSAISSGTGWGVALAGPVAILAGDAWRIAWGAFVALAVVAGAVAVRQAPRATSDVVRPRLSWTWFVCPRSRPLLGSAVLVGAGSAVWWSFSVDSLQEAGMESTPARVVYAVCGAAILLASLSGILFSRTGLRGGYLGTTALLAASLALLGLGREHLAAALVAAVLFGASYAAVIAAHGIWSSRVFADHPAAGLAAVSTALTLGTLLGPTLAGVGIERFGYGVTLLVAGAVVVAALPLCPPTERRGRQLAAHQPRCRAVPARP